ncbi:hypothetical protein GJAV_G00001180, partial [Gymnothorax javanicus]
MPRRKQSHPQPVKLGSEDGVAALNTGSLVLESDFLLGQDLEFGDNDNDYKIITFDKDSDLVAVEMGIPAYSLSDEDCSYSRLSLESEGEEGERGGGAALCSRCGRPAQDALQGALDLTEPCCLRCSQSEEGGAASLIKGGEVGGAAGGEAGGATGGAAAGGGAAGGSRKLHSCELCSFSSRYSNHLKRHMKTHNGEKPYRCPQSSATNAAAATTGPAAQSLKRHQMGHRAEETEPPEVAVVSDLTLHVSSEADFLQTYGG